MNSFYNEEGRMWQVWWSDEEYYAEWINQSLAVYKSFDSDKIIGVEVWT